MFVALAVLMVVALFVSAVIELTGVGKIGARGGRPGGEGGPAVLFVGLGAAAVAAGIVSWRVAGRLAAPLEQIGAATRELAAGRYRVRVPGSDTVELDALAGDVNALAGDLESTEAQRLRLIGDVAHELRNPLSTIEGTMEALLDGVMVADDDTYARIGREAARLRRLADDLSSLSAAGELGDLRHSPHGVRSPIDVADLCADVIAQLEPQASAKGLMLRFGSDGSRVTVDGDGDRLTQVLVNVVGNAIQYTDAGSVELRLSMRTAGGGALVLAPARDRVEMSEAVIEVVDTGRGLAALDESLIFERFHRSEPHLSDGTGVGLAIAKLIVEAHDGTIVARSGGLGAGTSVTIILPTASGS